MKIMLKTTIGAINFGDIVDAILDPTDPSKVCCYDSLGTSWYLCIGQWLKCDEQEDMKHTLKDILGDNVSEFSVKYK